MSPYRIKPPVIPVPWREKLSACLKELLNSFHFWTEFYSIYEPDEGGSTEDTGPR